MKNIALKATLVLLISFAFIQATDAHGRGYYNRRQCAPRYYQAPVRYYTSPGPRAYFAPQVYVGPAWIPGHWAIGHRGRQVWVPAHYR